MERAAPMFNKEFYSLVITYVVGSWGLIQFVDWFSKRYEFSSVWTDALGVSLILLIPSVLLFSWLRSNEAHQFRRSTLVYVLNTILVLVGVSSFTSFGKSSETTEQITVQDEEGNEKQVEISKKEYIREVIFLPFDNQEGEDWQALALPHLMSTNLSQSKRLSTTTAFEFHEELQKLDYQSGDALPENVKRKLLSESYADYAVSGKLVQKDKNTYDYEIALLGKEDKKNLFQKSGSTQDIYQLSDSLAQQIHDYIIANDLKIEPETFQAIPSRELLSPNLKALEFFFEGMTHRMNNRFEAALGLMSKAVELDPKFAEGHLFYGEMLVKSGKMDAVKSAVSKALQLSSSLTDNQQLIIKNYYYAIQAEAKKREKLLRMWIKLHPEANEPYLYLMSLLTQNYSDRNAAIEVGKMAEKAGHENTMLIPMSRLYARNGDSIQAKNYIERYKERFPEDQTINSKLGDIYYGQNDFRQAAEYYAAHKTFFPLDVDVNLDLYSCYFKLGQFKEAENLLNECIPLVKSFKDSIRLYLKLESYYENRGEHKKSIEKIEERLAFSAKYYPPTSILAEKADIANLRSYVYNSDTLNAKKRIEAYINSLEGDKDLYEMAIRFNYYYLLGEQGPFSGYFAQNKEKVKPLMGDGIFEMFEGYALKLSGEYDKAIEVLSTASENTTDEDVDFLLYDSYRLNANYEKAKAGFEKLLIDEPYDGIILLRYAQTLASNDEPEAAKKVLDKLFYLWENADEEFIYYKEALDLQKQIQLLN